MPTLKFECFVIYSFFNPDGIRRRTAIVQTMCSVQKLTIQSARPAHVQSLINSVSSQSHLTCPALQTLHGVIYSGPVGVLATGCHNDGVHAARV